MTTNDIPYPYQETARLAHELADILKRTKPHMRTEVDDLQCIITRSHRRIEGAESDSDVSAAWCEMEAAYQALRDLRRAKTD